VTSSVQCVQNRFAVGDLDVGAGKKEARHDR
jgi:hypothetical protein